jgi:electron transport complex protein RnfD
MVTQFAVGAAGALLGDWLAHFLRRGGPSVRAAHAATIGLLTVMMLPTETSRLSLACGAALGALLARALRDRFQTHIWHPAALAWVLVLAFGAYREDSLVAGAHRLLMQPVDRLVEAYAPVPGGGASRVRDLALHELPRWEATLIGGVPGGAGETCGLAILAGALWLVYMGNLRWQALASAMVGAALMAAIWPVRAAEGAWLWFPAVRLIDGFPIGMTLALYHLTGGGLLLAAVFHAADPISTPLNVRGHALFGAGLGAGTVVLRACGLPFGACWWMLLLMNTLVPLIDRVTRRRVWGT